MKIENVLFIYLPHYSNMKYEFMNLARAIVVSAYVEVRFLSLNFYSGETSFDYDSEESRGEQVVMGTYNIIIINYES